MIACLKGIDTLRPRKPSVFYRGEYGLNIVHTKRDVAKRETKRVVSRVVQPNIQRARLRGDRSTQGGDALDRQAILSSIRYEALTPPGMTQRTGVPTRSRQARPRGRLGLA